MNIALRSIVGVAALLVAAQASAQITFYEREGFRGQAFATDKQVSNFERAGFNDRASSVVVDRGRWEVCEDARFEGRCVVLRRAVMTRCGDWGWRTAFRPCVQSKAGGLLPTKHLSHL